MSQKRFYKLSLYAVLLPQAVYAVPRSHPGMHRVAHHLDSSSFVRRATHTWLRSFALPAHMFKALHLHALTKQPLKVKMHPKPYSYTLPKLPFYALLGTAIGMAFTV